MTDSSQPNPQRDFNCKHCNGRIMIPFSLPSSTGPCPHCQETITSPPPPEPQAQEPSAFAAPARKTPPQPNDEPIPQPIPQPIAEPIAETAAIPPSEEQAEVPEPQPVASPAKQKKRSSGIIPAVIGLFFLILAGGAAYYYFSKPKDGSVDPPSYGGSPKEQGSGDADYIRIGWQADAYRTLAAFMEGANVGEKLPHIRSAESLRAQMERFYGEVANNDKDTPANAFSVRELTEEVRKRGIFMLSFDQPPRSATEPVRVHAFFKTTEQGLKLDWEIFAQTKYRTFRKFTELPEIGARETFRVLIAEDAPDKGYAGTETRTYRMMDPANLDDSARVNVKVDSENGRELSVIHWRGSEQGSPIIRTATVELEWASPPDKPVLSMRRFIYWEFLGLGGTEIPATEIPE